VSLEGRERGSPGGSDSWHRVRVGFVHNQGYTANLALLTACSWDAFADGALLGSLCFTGVQMIGSPTCKSSSIFWKLNSVGLTWVRFSSY
jgi:hypothetical protein